MPPKRSGLTLVEVMIAVLVFAVGALGLAATSAVLVRQLASSEQRSRAADMAAARLEKLNASPCSLSSSADVAWGITNTWATAAGGSRVTLEQSLVRRDSKGPHTDRFLAAVPCD